MSSRIESGLTIEGSVRGEGELVVAGRLRGALVLGVIYVDSTGRADGVHEQAETLRALASLVGVSVENARLFAGSLTLSPVWSITRPESGTSKRAVCPCAAQQSRGTSAENVSAWQASHATTLRRRCRRTRDIDAIRLGHGRRGVNRTPRQPGRHCMISTSGSKTTLPSRVTLYL